MKQISAQALKPLLTDGDEIAFLDVREHGQYGEGHPFFCVSLPYSQLETLAPRLMPCLAVRCVVMDDGDGVASRAASALQRIGYSDISILAGGAPAWGAAGYTLFKGVNLPSKTFGELVEHEFDTAAVSAEELNDLQQEGADILVLDGRSGPEFRKMSLPNALSCPNAELGYRLPMFNADPTTPLIVNCAGRTRSIIGAQTLNMLGIPNPVYALRNGTQGWRLAGFDLVHGSDPLPLPQPDTQTWEKGAELAAKLCRDYSLRHVSFTEAQAWLSDDRCTTYLFDVRSKEEYENGHPAGARSAPGGQLVQATDEQLAVRNAKIILSCDNGLRSATTAIWLTGMGHQVWILDADAPREVRGRSDAAKIPIVETIDLQAMKQRVDAGAQILDASNGLDYRSGHIDGARWVTRARFDLSSIADAQEVVLTGRCPIRLAGLATEIEMLTGQAPRYIAQGDPESWRSAGFEIIETPNSPSEADCIDHLFFVHDRHDGNLDAARRYLEWEVGLLAQLDDQERRVLRPLHPVNGSKEVRHAT